MERNTHDQDLAVFAAEYPQKRLCMFCTAEP
ncbi:hypothetical protein PAM7066_00068 [Palleronia marisminoris]|uniref:Uncharacterized protein n=1 Tax=Palleronia marisminoris TaxID=315423 RepID=A0A1Y5R8L1_9RHOB|nr:hypothetical protein PAM7066_00068 [Palleronia marisminoris]